MPAILIALYAVAQIVASLQGLETYLGVLGALFVIALCLYFRFTLPLTIAAFLCAKNVWGWHWFFALLFVAPGLAFLLPAIAAVVIGSLLAILPWGKMHKRRSTSVDDGIIEGEYEEVFDLDAPPMRGGAQARRARIEPEQQAVRSGRPAWRRGLKAAFYIIGIGVGVVIAIGAMERSRQPDAGASYNAVEPINDMADFGVPVETPVAGEVPAQLAIPPLDDADLQMAVSEFDRIYSETGMSGAADHSRDCHNRLATSHMVGDFDRCIGFDRAAALIEEAASRHGFPPDYYFREVSADDSVRAAGRLVSDDDAIINDRIQRIRAGIAVALNRLGEQKAANNGYGALPAEASSDESNAY